METNYKISDCTHLLSCRHAIGLNGYNYSMKCILLKTTNNGKAKILVFGERNWKGHEDKKRVRYVEFTRLSKM